MSILAAAAGVMGVSPIVPSAAWGNISTPIGVSATNANVTLTYGGSTRTIKVTHALALTDLEYRVNSGAYTACPTDTTFSVPSGQTLNFRATGAAFTEGPTTISIKDTSRGDLVVGTFTVTIT